MISDALSASLQAGRARFNTQFAEARRLYPTLNGDDFGGFLCAVVDPLASAVAKIRSDCVTQVVQAAYRIGLELTGQKLAGPGARHRHIEAAWQRVLPPISSLVATAPERMLASASNVAHHLYTSESGRPEQWLELMALLGPQCNDADTWLKLGQVAAWKAGLAHYRLGAIAIASLLPEPLALDAVGAPAKTTWASVRARLLADPWFDPAEIPAKTDEQTSRPRVLAAVGQFRGFGGIFSQPPLVAVAGEELLVRSGDDSWLLTADRFGATFHRIAVEDFEAARKQPPLPPWLRLEETRVTSRMHTVDLPGLGQISSAAANRTTLAITSPLSHSIALVALEPAPPLTT